METIVQQWLKRAAIVSAVVAGATVIFLFDPAQHDFYPRCPFHTLTGLDCPGCGSTRALHELVHGHVGAAMRLNPLAVLALPALALGLAIRPRLRKPECVWILLTVTVAFGIFRNVLSPNPEQPTEETSYMSNGKPAGAEKKVPAGIFGILLGWLGVHKFYLGYTTEGILQILLTVVCGVGWLIGIIEGVIYLTKSDEDFVKTYITSKKGWF